MLKVDFKYEEDGVEVHHKGSEQNLVLPQIGPSLRLALAEAPGKDESIAGQPLVGGSGRVMNMLWGKANVKRESLTILNVIQCRPPANMFPTDGPARRYISIQDAEEAVRHCYFNHIRPLLLSRPWSRLDIIGGKALQLLTGKADITKWRGSPLDIDTEEIDKRMK